jgi:hypothetical protein
MFAFIHGKIVGEAGDSQVGWLAEDETSDFLTILST